MQKIVNYIQKKANIILIFLGIIFRLKHYVGNRSFWLDEAWVAITIMSRSFKEIILSFPIFPKHPELPLIFSVIQKFSSMLLGNTEYSFRLYSILAGILSIILFFNLIKKYLNSKAITIALFIFAFSDPLVYYSAELKQYASDVLMTVLFYLFVERFINKDRITHKDGWIFGLLAGVFIWISHTCIFIFAGVYLVFVAENLFKKRIYNIHSLLITVGIFFISFGVLYTSSIQFMTSNQDLHIMWKDYFMPKPLLSLNSLIWIKNIFLAMFKNPLGLYMPILSSILFFVGSISIFSKDRERFFLIISPIILTFVASILHKYPFSGRLLLFLVPNITIILSEGIGFIIRKKYKGSIIVSIILITFLFFKPAIKQFNYLFKKRLVEENREVLSYFKDHYLSGDFLYMNMDAQYSYWFYYKNLGICKLIDAQKLDLETGEEIIGNIIGRIDNDLTIDDYTKAKYFGFKYEFHVYDENNHFRYSLILNKDLNINRKVYKFSINSFVETKRVWVYLSHIDQEAKRFILNSFNSQGKCIDKYERKGAAIYLFDLRPDEDNKSKNIIKVRKFQQ